MIDMPMVLKGCDFLLTFKCVAKCRHCSYRGSPERSGVMSVDDFRRYMTVLATEQSLDWITFHGGEPFLFYKTLVRCIEIAHKLGQKEIAVITNGYWGGSQTNAQTKLRELKKAGLTSVFFSVDAFHQEHVPFRSVHTAINVARAVDFEKITVSSCYLGSVDSDNSFNRKTEECLKRLKLPDDFQIDKHSLNVQGRATDTLTSNLKHRAGIPQGKCVLPYWAGETLKDPKVIEIDYMGNVSICPGLCIGNTKNESLSKTLRDYDYRKHPIIKLLAEHGPCKLIDLLESKTQIQPGKYVNECHLCYELRNQLRASFLELLAPENCYEEQ